MSHIERADTFGNTVIADWTDDLKQTDLLCTCGWELKLVNSGGIDHARRDRSIVLMNAHLQKHKQEEQ